MEHAERTAILTRTNVLRRRLRELTVHAARRHRRKAWQSCSTGSTVRESPTDAPRYVSSTPPPPPSKGAPIMTNQTAENTAVVQICVDWRPRERQSAGP
jgi:hypothetical protein